MPVLNASDKMIITSSDLAVRIVAFARSMSNGQPQVDGRVRYKYSEFERVVSNGCRVVEFTNSVYVTRFISFNVLYYTESPFNLGDSPNACIPLRRTSMCNG